MFGGAAVVDTEQRSTCFFTRWIVDFLEFPSDFTFDSMMFYRGKTLTSFNTL